MAATSASRSWSTLVKRGLATSAVAAVALLATAVPASAHTHTLWAECDGADAFAHVKLDFYKKDVKNSVVITMGGVTLASNSNFKDKFKWDSEKLDGTVKHEILVKVTAGDDQKYSFEETLTTKVCKQPPSEQPPPEQPPPPVVTTTTPPAAPPAPVTTTTTTTPPAIGANANLAETGASIALPLGIGALLLVGGGVLLLVMRRRGKA